MLKNVKIGKDKKRAPAHDVLLSEIHNDVSALSDNSNSKEDRQIYIRSIETKCSVLGQMDIPKDVHTGTENKIKVMLDAIKMEIDSKTEASKVISTCLKDMQGR